MSRRSFPLLDAVCVLVFNFQSDRQHGGFSYVGKLLREGKAYAPSRRSVSVVRVLRHASLGAAIIKYWRASGSFNSSRGGKPAAPSGSTLNPTVNNDTLMWNAGNLGDRRPQLRFETGTGRGSGRLELASGIALGGAADATDIDGDGFRDAESSGRPNFQTRLGYRRGSTLNVGVWGHRGWQRAVLSSPVLFSTQVLGADSLDDPVNRDLSPSGIERNRAWYWADRIFLAHGLELALDYIYWSTRFQNKPSGLNHRTNFFMQYRF